MHIFCPLLENMNYDLQCFTCIRLSYQSHLMFTVSISHIISVNAYFLSVSSSNLVFYAQSTIAVIWGRKCPLVKTKQKQQQQQQNLHFLCACIWPSHGQSYLMFTVFLTHQIITWTSPFHIFFWTDFKSDQHYIKAIKNNNCSVVFYLHPLWF